MLKRKSSTRFATFWKGFSLIELIVTIAIMAVLTAVLVPSLFKYTEYARAQRDLSATGEMTNAVKVCIARQEVYDELIQHSKFNNVSCYVDTPKEEYHLNSKVSDLYSQYSFNDQARTKDRTPYYAAGNMCGVTITFEPNANSKGSTYILENGIINKFVPKSDQTLSDLPNLNKEMREIIGRELQQYSQTYRNAEYTIFVDFGYMFEKAEIYGQYSGTNLTNDNIDDHDYTTTTDRTTVDPGGDDGIDPGNNDGGVAVIDDTPCDHVTTTVNAVPATCTTEGYSGDKICSECGERIAMGEVIPVTGHKEKTVNRIEATCTTVGYTGDVVCEWCESPLGQGQVIPMAEHDVETKASIAPTCDKEGSAGGGVCKNCGLVIDGATIIPALGHNYKEISWEWDDVKSAKARLTCDACGYVETVDATITTKVIDGTCESAGEVAYTATVTVNEKSYTDSKRKTVEAVGHIANEKATCTSPEICDVCGTKIKDALGHVSVNGGTKDAHKKCSRCGIALDSNHTYSSSIYTAATCTTKGTTKYVCDCGYSYTDQNIAIDPNNHSGSSVYGGSKDIHTKYSCCGKTISSAHIYASTVSVAATCTTKGTTKYTCVCGYNYTAQDIAINPNNHTGSSINGGSNNVHTKYSCCGATISSAHIYSSKVTTAATCTANGVRTYTCGCGHAYTESLAATGHTSTYGGTSGVHTKCSTCGTTLSTSHSYSYSTVSYASCTSSGTGKYSCACGYYYTTTISAYGHSYSSSVTTAATCTSNGVRTYKCSCGSSYTESIPATGHTPGAAATCTAAQTCTKCSATIVSATGHNYSEATCTTAKTCSKCGATSGSVPGHSWVAATCTEPKTCSRCGTTSGTKNGHSYSDATCTTPKTCSACGKTSGEKLGHSYSAATCTTPQTCSRCSKTKGDATGHSWSAATCTSPKTCSKCSATSGSKLGHSWNSATCTKAKTCSRCGTTSGSALGHTAGAAATCGTPQTCVRCSYVFHEALGHRWLTKDGKTTCNRCGISYTEY